MNNQQSRPHCLEGTSNAALQCTQHVHARFADKSWETNGKPVDNVAAVNGDEINKRINKHCKDFGVRIVKHSRKNVRDALQLQRTLYTQTHMANCFNLKWLSFFV